MVITFQAQGSVHRLNMIARNTDPYVYPKHFYIDNVQISEVGATSTCKVEYSLEYAADYYPYGKILREFQNGLGAEKYLTTHHERDKETGLTYAGARLLDHDVVRWNALDEKATKYPSVSAYNYVLGNPVKFIDPDGKDVTIHGTDANSTFTEIQKVTSLNLSINSTGKLSVDLPKGPILFSLAGLTELDIAIATAINDGDVSVNLFTTQNQFEKSHSDENRTIEIEVGAFDGNKILPNGRVITSQIFNIIQARNEEAGGGNTTGTNAAHEVIESYFIGKDSPNTSAADVAKGEKNAIKNYLKGHSKAAKVDRNFSEAQASDKSGMIRVNGNDIDLNKKID